MTVIPKPGFLIPMPGGGVLPAEGAVVDSTSEYWIRRIADGDVTVSGVAPSPRPIFQFVASGTTAERPDPAEEGMFRFNTDLRVFEGFDGTAWVPSGGGIVTPLLSSLLLEDGGRFLLEDGALLLLE